MKILASVLSACFVLNCTVAHADGFKQMQPTEPATLRALAQSQSLAQTARKQSSLDGFQKFKSSVYKEPQPNGVYIVNGDTPILNDTELLNFYKSEIVKNKKTSSIGIELIIDAPDKRPTPLDIAIKNRLTYCIGNTFGERYQAVADAMKEATSAWEKSSDVSFFHVPALDDNCNESASNVVFDVRPVSKGNYFARAFLPRFPRMQRNILIHDRSFDLAPKDKLQLAGILRHEIGHILGFRHEQTRPEAGTCFEDKEWMPITSYDAFSVMHYPQCNGLGDWSFNLTDTDKLGAACMYGAPKGTPFDTAKCQPIAKSEM